MLNIIKRMIANFYYYAKEILAVLWYGSTIEGEAITKSLSIAHKAWRTNDLHHVINEEIEDFVKYVQENPIKSAAIAGVVASRYAVPLGLLPTTKVINEKIATVIQKRIPRKVKEIYHYAWQCIDQAFTNKFLDTLPLNESAWSLSVKNKVMKEARKIKHALQDAWEFEKKVMDILTKKYPNYEWRDFFNRPEYEHLKLCINSFASLEEFSCQERLVKALADLKKLKEMMFECDLITGIVQQISTREVLTNFGKLINLLPSNKVVVAGGTLLSMMRKMLSHQAPPMLPAGLLHVNQAEQAVEIHQQNRLRQADVHEEHRVQGAAVHDHVTKKSYPNLLTQFGCYQRKLDSAKVANALWLIQSNHGHDKAREVKQQLSLWAQDKQPEFKVQEVEHCIKQTYKF